MIPSNHDGNFSFLSNEESCMENFQCLYCYSLGIISITGKYDDSLQLIILLAQEGIRIKLGDIDTLKCASSFWSLMLFFCKVNYFEDQNFLVESKIFFLSVIAYRKFLRIGQNLAGEIYMEGWRYCAKMPIRAPSQGGLRWCLGSR